MAWEEAEPISLSSGVSAEVRRIAKKPRWSAADAGLVIAAGERSGLTWAEFAGRLVVGVWRLSWWRSRLEEAARGGRRPAITFVPVTSPECASATPERNRSANGVVGGQVDR